MIEGIDKFTEKDNVSESRLKFWFPKYFPTRFKVIVTANRTSQSYVYLKKLGCQILNLQTTNDMMFSVIRNYNKRKFIMSDVYTKTVFEILKQKIEDFTVEDALFIKSVIGCLCPYQTPQIVTVSPAATSQLVSVLETFDIKR